MRRAANPKRVFVRLESHRRLEQAGGDSLPHKLVLVPHLRAVDRVEHQSVEGPDLEGRIEIVQVCSIRPLLLAVPNIREPVDDRDFLFELVQVAAVVNQGPRLEKIVPG
jgi:hypothetical protein